jgi:alkylated DNA repair dioxygenase AlkB
VLKKVAWFGEKDAVYRYSGVVHHPLPCLSSLKRIQRRLVQEHNIQNNSVLCNLYKDGQNYMGWHQDKENELGKVLLLPQLALEHQENLSLAKNKLEKKVQDKHIQ